MRISRPAAALATTAVLILGGAAYGIHTVTDSHNSDNDVSRTANPAFLSAWQAGDIGKARPAHHQPQQARTELAPTKMGPVSPT